MARFGSEEARREGYESEKQFRWTFENFYRDPVITSFCHIIGKGTKCTWKRNDSEVTTARDMEKLPDYVKGTPDYLLTYAETEILVELKLKTKKFLKSKHDGNDFPGYSSESHYIDPYVIDQIKAHCDNKAISASDVLVLFAFNGDGEDDFKEMLFDPSKWEYGSLRLSTIIKRIKEGQYVQLPRKDSGYGQPSYLIPINALRPPEEFPKYFK